jgi:hypothetical protein
VQPWWPKALWCIGKTKSRFTLENGRRLIRLLLTRHVLWCTSVPLTESCAMYLYMRLDCASIYIWKGWMYSGLKCTPDLWILYTGTLLPLQLVHHSSSSWSSSVICQTTGPKPLPERFLHIVRSRASCFNWQYPLLSLRSSSSFLRLLPILLVTSICPINKLNLFLVRVWRIMAVLLV